MWALQNYGFKAVISSRFADIFRGNSGKAGLVAAQVDEKVVQRIWDWLDELPRRGGHGRPGEPNGHAPGRVEDAIVDSFDIDDYTRWRLLEGLDDIGITLGHDADIAAFEGDPTELETRYPKGLSAFRRFRFPKEKRPETTPW